MRWKKRRRYLIFWMIIKFFTHGIENFLLNRVVLYLLCIFFFFFFVESSLLTRHDFIHICLFFYAKYIACIEIFCIQPMSIIITRWFQFAPSHCFHFLPCYVDNTTTTILKYCNFSNKKINNIIKKSKCAFSTEATNLGSE